jgi:hypothetical protein
MILEDAVKMDDKANRKRAGEEIAPAQKRQRQEQQQRPHWIEAAQPPSVQMGFVRGGSRGNNSGCGGYRSDARGGHGGGDGLRGGFGRGDGRYSFRGMRRSGGLPYGRY